MSQQSIILEACSYIHCKGVPNFGSELEVGQVKWEQSVVFIRFASYSVVILTIQKPDFYSALASKVQVGQSY